MKIIFFIQDNIKKNDKRKNLFSSPTLVPFSSLLAHQLIFNISSIFSAELKMKYLKQFYSIVLSRSAPQKVHRNPQKIKEKKIFICPKLY